MGGSWFVLATVALAAGVGAYLLLPGDTVPPGDMSIHGDACSGIRASPQVWPTRPPDGELNVTITDGEDVRIMQGPGVWRAKVLVDGATISLSRPLGPPSGDWTREYDLAWCHARPEPKVFHARGNGTLHLRAWEGVGDGLAVS